MVSIRVVEQFLVHMQQAYIDHSPKFRYSKFSKSPMDSGMVPVNAFLPDDDLLGK